VLLTQARRDARGQARQARLFLQPLRWMSQHSGARLLRLLSGALLRHGLGMRGLWMIGGDGVRSRAADHRRPGLLLSPGRLLPGQVPAVVGEALAQQQQQRHHHQRST